jgi:hypothetical protein
MFTLASKPVLMRVITSGKIVCRKCQWWDVVRVSRHWWERVLFRNYGAFRCNDCNIRFYSRIDVVVIAPDVNLPDLAQPKLRKAAHR